MTLKYVIASLAISIVAIIISITFFLSAPPVATDSLSKVKTEPRMPAKSYDNDPVQYLAPSDNPNDQKKSGPSLAIQDPIQPASDSNKIYTADRQVVMDKIQEAMSTYSAEGVPVLKNFLASPDVEIREHAIEAMKQIDAPEAAIALREIANKTTDPRDRQAMLDAADFVELPHYVPPR